MHDLQRQKHWNHLGQGRNSAENSHMAVRTPIGHALLGSYTRSLLALTPATWTALEDNMVREKMPCSDGFEKV